MPERATGLALAGNGSFKPFCNGGRKVGLSGVVTEHFLGAVELDGSLLLGALLLVPSLSSGFFQVVKFGGVAVHGGGMGMASSGLIEIGGKGFAGAVKFAADGVAGLAGDGTDLFVTEFVAGHEQEQDAVFFRQSIERLLNALTEFLGFEDAQRAVLNSPGVIEDRFVIGAVDVPPVPGLEQILAVVDGDAIEPGAETGMAFEVAEFAKGLEEDVVGRILSLRGIAEHPKSEVIDRTGMFLIDGVQLGRFEGDPGRWRGFVRRGWGWLHRFFGDEG